MLLSCYTLNVVRLQPDNDGSAKRAYFTRGAVESTNVVFIDQAEGKSLEAYNAAVRDNAEIGPRLPPACSYVFLKDLVHPLTIAGSVDEISRAVYRQSARALLFLPPQKPLSEDDDA